MATNVPVYISYGGRALVVWECDKYTVGRAGLDLVSAQEGSGLSLFRAHFTQTEVALHAAAAAIQIAVASVHAMFTTHDEPWV